MRKKICILNTGGTILARGDKNSCENSCENDDKNDDKNGYKAGGLGFLDVFEIPHLEILQDESKLKELQKILSKKL